MSRRGATKSIIILQRFREANQILLVTGCDGVFFCIFSRFFLYSYCKMKIFFKIFLCFKKTALIFSIRIGFDVSVVSCTLSAISPDQKILPPRDVCRRSCTECSVDICRVVWRYRSIVPSSWYEHTHWQHRHAEARRQELWCGSNSRIRGKIK